MPHRCLIQTQMAMHIPDVSQQPLEFELLHCPGCGNHYSSDTLYERLPDTRAGTDEVQLLDLTDDEESMTLHVYRHYMLNLSDKIEHWQVVRREAEEKVLELQGELDRARNHVEGIEADRRRILEEQEEINPTIERMLAEIDGALQIIDVMNAIGIELPPQIQMHLECLHLLPSDAQNSVAAAAFHHLCRHIANTGDKDTFAKLDKHIADIVNLAMCRFIDAKDKERWNSEMFLTFGDDVSHAIRSKLGSSYFQIFRRNLVTHPMKLPGSAHAEREGPRHRPRCQTGSARRRGSKKKKTRTTSEPVSETRRVLLCSFN